MTLTSVRTEIIDILLTQDTISPSDFASIEIDDELELQRDPLILAALADLTEAGVLRYLPPAVPAEVPNGMGIWILTAPLGVAGQDVHIALPTAIHIASEINAFRDAFEMHEEWPPADPLQLGEHNVLMLLAIVTQLRADYNDEAGEHGGSGEGRN